MTSSFKSSPYLAQVRRRQGPLGSFHRSNWFYLLVAAMVHLLTVWAMFTFDTPKDQLGVLLLEILFVGFIGAASGVSSVLTQYLSAARRGAWDEILVTPLPSRVIVHAQLVLAMQPLRKLFLLISPSLLVLAFVAAFNAMQSHRQFEETLTALAIMVLLLLAIGFGTYVLNVMTLQMLVHWKDSAFGSLPGMIGVMIVVCIAISMTVFGVIWAWLLLVGMAIYGQRSLSVSLREAILAHR